MYTPSPRLTGSFAGGRTIKIELATPLRANTAQAGRQRYDRRLHRITEACCFLFATLLSLWLDINAVQHDSVYRWIILSMLDVSVQL
jgi:hypothetical protein